MKNRDVSITQQPPFLQELQKPTAAKKIACFLSIFSLLTNLTSVPVPRIPDVYKRQALDHSLDNFFRFLGLFRVVLNLSHEDFFLMFDVISAYFVAACVDVYKRQIPNT